MVDIIKLEFGQDGIARIVMCNGENRLRTSTLRTWAGVLDNVIGNKDINGLVITGEGKFFSNGIDLDWVTTQTDRDRQEYIDGLHELITRLLVFPIPTVAVVNGHAFGAGAFLAIACDYRVMRAGHGWLCWPEVVLKFRFSKTLLNVLRAKVSVGPARRDAIVYGRRLTARAAEQLGLVDVVATEVPELEMEGRKLLKNAIGSKGIDRDVLHAAKRDLYGKGLTFSKL